MVVTPLPKFPMDQVPLAGTECDQGVVDVAVTRLTGRNQVPTFLIHEALLTYCHDLRMAILRIAVKIPCGWDVCEYPAWSA